MTSIKYNKIYSRLFTKIEAYDFIKLPEDALNEFLCDWIHSASANPNVRKLFSALTLDDELQNLSYEIKYSVDESSDAEFIIEIISMGMAIAWLEPKVESFKTIAQTYASKEEKYYSEAQHISELRGLLKDLQSRQRRMITDRSGIWNTYLDGE